jgi:hypothetical protein
MLPATCRVRGSLYAPANRLTGDEAASAGLLQNSHTDRRDRHGGAHDPEHMRFVEQQHVSYDPRIGETRPCQCESEHHTAQKADDSRFHDDPPVSQAHTCANATAVPKNVIAATMLAGEPSYMPVSPRPDVHPPAVRAPTPIAKPATTKMPSCRKGSAGNSPLYDGDGKEEPVVNVNSAPPITIPASRKALIPRHDGRVTCSVTSM